MVVQERGPAREGERPRFPLRAGLVDPLHCGLAVAVKAIS